MRVQLLMLVATFGLTACVIGDTTSYRGSGDPGTLFKPYFLSQLHGSQGTAEAAPPSVAATTAPPHPIESGPAGIWTPRKLLNYPYHIYSPGHEGDVDPCAPVATRWQFHQWKGELNCLEVAYVAQNVLPLFSTKDVQLFSKADGRKTSVGLRVKILTLADSP
jgi:hypothetical protein